MWQCKKLSHATTKNPCSNYLFVNCKSLKFNHIPFLFLIVMYVLPPWDSLSHSLFFTLWGRSRIQTNICTPMQFLTSIISHLSHLAFCCWSDSVGSIQNLAGMLIFWIGRFHMQPISESHRGILKTQLIRDSFEWKSTWSSCTLLFTSAAPSGT